LSPADAAHEAFDEPPVLRARLAGVAARGRDGIAPLRLALLRRQRIEHTWHVSRRIGQKNSATFERDC
jgi:hypothetical protein